MSYTSKYTGNEIDELLDKVKSNNNIVIKRLNDSVAVLATGENCILNDDITNYDCLIVVSGLSTSNDDSLFIFTKDIDLNNSEVYQISRDGGTSTAYGALLQFKFTNAHTITGHYSWMGSSMTNKNWGISKVYGLKINTTTSSNDSAPIGNIISFMGTKAPNGYLVCDGAELEISKYAKLAAHFEEQFGTKNHFGGNGTTTFAVPDLRNEFLRGYHNGKDEQLSREVGIHQDATAIPRFGFNIDAKNMWFDSLVYDDGSDSAYTTNFDKYIKTTSTSSRSSSTFSTTWVGSGNSKTTVRPTNVAVLYCIKY